MTTYCFVHNSLIAEAGGTDAFLTKLCVVGGDKMASWRCWFVNAAAWCIRVERLKNEAYINVYDQGGRVRSSCPTSLIGAIVDWNARRAVWRRDGVKERASRPKRKAKKDTIKAGTYPSPASGKEALF